MLLPDYCSFILHLIEFSGAPHLWWYSSINKPVFMWLRVYIWILFHESVSDLILFPYFIHPSFVIIMIFFVHILHLTLLAQEVLAKSAIWINNDWLTIENLMLLKSGVLRTGWSESFRNRWCHNEQSFLFSLIKWYWAHTLYDLRADEEL